MIFSINAGRSGSNYLAELFSTLENVTSLHEPGRNHGGVRHALQVRPKLMVEASDRSSHVSMRCKNTTEGEV